MSWLPGVIWIAGLIFISTKTPDKAVSKVGQDPVVWVKNAAPDSASIFIMAPDVDHAVRHLGYLGPADSAGFKSPYGGTEAYLIAFYKMGGGEWLKVKIE